MSSGEIEEGRVAIGDFFCFSKKIYDLRRFQREKLWDSILHIMDTKNGTIIDGRYEFISTLGKGTSLITTDKTNTKYIFTMQSLILMLSSFWLTP